MAVPSLRSPVSSSTSTLACGDSGRILAQRLHPLVVDYLVVPGRFREPLPPLDLRMNRSRPGPERPMGIRLMLRK